MEPKKRSHLLDGLKPIKPEELAALQQTVEKKLKYNSWVMLGVMIFFFFTLIYVVSLFNDETARPNRRMETIHQQEVKQLKQQVNEQQKQIDQLLQDIQTIKKQVNEE
ncbi:hypothetical protein [Atopobacter phocae]|uniref:hypothetical protein n=1 Tax=Atopobacter phocae TaxID=136492 RepID=UPI00046EE2E9|nr:hypothetical protein [Atopobacter phocae]